MTDTDTIAARFLRRLNIGHFLARMGEWLAIVLSILGVCVLVVRLLTPDLWPEILWLCMCIVPVGYFAWRLSKKQKFTRLESIALFDSKLQSGGLLMAISECHDESWSEYLPQHEEEWHSLLPRIRPIRFLKVVIVPLLFLTVVCLIPLQSHSEQGRQTGTIQQKTTQKLQQMLDGLNEAHLLEPEQTQQFQEDINKLKNQYTDSAMTHERWETVDTIEARLKQKAEQTVRTMRQAQQSLKILKTNQMPSEHGSLQNEEATSQIKLPGAKKRTRKSSVDSNKKTKNKTKKEKSRQNSSENRKMGQKLNEEQKRQLVENVSKALKTMLENNSDLLSQLSPEMLEKIQEMMKQNSQFDLPDDPELKEQLLNELQNLMKNESQRFQEMMQKLQRSGKLKELQNRLAAGQKSASRRSDRKSSSRRSNQNQSGKMGISRGPGSSPIDGTHPLSKSPTNFRDIVLPPGFRDKTKKETARIEMKEPEIETEQKTIRGNRKIEIDSSNLESFKRRIRPKHRQAVRKYFESKKKK